MAKVNIDFCQKELFFIFVSLFCILIPNEHLKILLTGMSDLCSPMIMLLEDEADAFWCFERLMRRLVNIHILTTSSLLKLKTFCCNSRIVNVISLWV